MAIIKYFSALQRNVRIFEMFYSDNPTVRLVAIGEAGKMSFVDAGVRSDYSKHICRLLEDDNEIIVLGALRAITYATEKMVLTLVQVWNDISIFYYSVFSETLYSVCEKNREFIPLITKKIEVYLFDTVLASVKSTGNEDSLIWLTRYIKSAMKDKANEHDREKLAHYFSHESAKKGIDGTAAALFIKTYNLLLYEWFIKYTDRISRIEDIRLPNENEGKIICCMLEILARLQYEKIDELTFYFSESRDPEMLSAVVRVYSSVRGDSKNAVEIYEKTLKNDNQKVVFTTLEMIGKLHLKKFLSEIHTAALQEKPENIPQYVRVAANLSDFAKIDFFYTLLEVKNDETLLIALDFLSKYKDKKPLDKVWDILQRTDSCRVKAFCLKYMWNIGLSDAFEVLIEMMKSHDAQVRKAVVEVFDSFVNTVKIKYMLYLLKDPDNFIANKAQLTIEKMRGTDSVYLIIEAFEEIEKSVC